MKNRLLLLVLCLLPLCVACSETNDTPSFPTAVGIESRVAATGLDHPWELVWGPDNWIWFTERGGAVGRLDPVSGEVQRVHTIADVWANGESGLLGLAMHPDFPNTPHLFVAYTYDDGSRKEKIVRYTYNGTTLVEPMILLDGLKANTFHDGCRLLIHDNKLFITTGDAGDQSTPQNKNALNGKILRLNLDGTVPTDNPIAGSAVWSWGHRNPQGFVMASNGIMYSSEHGPSSNDELNIIEKGRNYGWPTVEGFCDLSNEKTFCQANDVKEPIAAWTPTLAVSGTTYYNSDHIPQWKNSVLMLTLKEKQLMVLKLSADGKRVDSQLKAFDNQFGRLRGICVSPDGRVYFSSNDEATDVVVEVKASVAKRKSSVNETSELIKN
jgi:aldose sugar dehydrogenase